MSCFILDTLFNHFVRLRFLFSLELKLRSCRSYSVLENTSSSSSNSDTDCCTSVIMFSLQSFLFLCSLLCCRLGICTSCVWFSGPMSFNGKNVSWMLNYLHALHVTDNKHILEEVALFENTDEADSKRPAACKAAHSNQSRVMKKAYKVHPSLFCFHIHFISSVNFHLSWETLNWKFPFYSSSLFILLLFFSLLFTCPVFLF